MCMIQDDKGNVLVLDKVNDSYTGTTFPGGHVEANEIFQKSMIREVWEETGLTIEVPKLGGLYHWHKSGVHYVITLYKANKFTGELKSSEEGRVYWIPLEELKTRELATGMEYVLQILESEQVGECYTCAFQSLYYQADKIHQGPLPVPVRLMMDEFCNVALPSDFVKIQSTMRSRNIMSTSHFPSNFCMLPSYH